MRRFAFHIGNLAIIYSVFVNYNFTQNVFWCCFQLLRPFCEFRYTVVISNLQVTIKNISFSSYKGSRKWERRGVRIVANVRYQVSDRGDRYLFTFWTCRFCVQIQFPFPFVITKWIGDYFDNRLCAANFGASIYLRVTNMIDLFWPANGDADQIRSAIF